MNDDGISIVSIHSLHLADQMKDNDKIDESHVISNERSLPGQKCSHQDENHQIGVEKNQPSQSEKRNQETKNSEEQKNRLQESNRGTDAYSNVIDISRTVATLIGIVAASVLCAVPWTTIPRTNSIIHQSCWMELLLPGGSYVILKCGNDLLDITV